MNNPTAPGRQGPLPDLKSLIRPELIRQMDNPPFPEESKEKYISGVTELWQKIDNQNPNTEEYQKAHRKLYEVTLNIKQTMQKVRAGQHGGNRPMISGLPGQQQEARPAAQNTQGAAPPQGPPKFSQKVVEQVKSLTFTPPPDLNGNETAMKSWIRDAQQKYATNLKAIEDASMNLNKLHQAANARNQQGKPLDQRESENYRGQVSRLDQMIREGKQTIHNFNMQQEASRKEQGHGQTGSGGSAASTSQAPNGTSTGVGGPPQIKQEPQSQPHTISSAVDAARNQTNSAARSAMSPHYSGQLTQPQINQLPNSRPQPNQNLVSHSHPPLNINTNPRPQDAQHNSPRVAPSHPSAIPHEPVPLSHSAAVDAARDAARSFSQPNIPQQTPQSATQGPSSDQRNHNNHAKMPIPKDLHLPPTQPVSVGPSRPTLTNGPIAMGPIGQPAIQRHPGFILEGEGERVLSKKKLEELVRQVTGGTGGEGGEGEGLTAEVEEVRLTLLQHQFHNLTYRTNIDTTIDAPPSCR
jgi:transcription initiation factor TFIID subunit 12